MSVTISILAWLDNSAEYSLKSVFDFIEQPAKHFVSDVRAW